MPRKRARPSRNRPVQTIIWALLLILAIYIYRSETFQRLLEVNLPAPQEAGQSPSPSSGGALPSSGAIQVFFTTPALVYPDRPNQRGASPLLQAILKDIDAAQKSVDLATFDFDIVEVADALLRAKERGVTVRLIVDSENLSDPRVAEQTGRLEQAAVPVHFDDREPFMHNKFLVVDGAIVWSGSWNVTTNDTFRNNNNMLRFESPQMNENYAREFEQMFDGRFGTSKDTGTPYPQLSIGANQIAVYFSPQDGIATDILQQLNAAKTSIHFMVFSYTSDPIAEAMIEQARRGITVQGVFERQNAEGTGADFRKLQEGGIDVIKDGNCYILHHKVIVIDERTVITGSYNFTRSAEEQNDENLIIVDDPTIAQAYMEEFRRVRNQAENPTRCS